MPNPVRTINQSVDPTNTATKLSGKPPRGADLNVDLNALADRVTKLEKLVSGGILFTSPDGFTTMRLTIDNSGNPVWTRQ